VHAGPRDAPWSTADSATEDKPQARPGPPFTDLLGRQPVRIVAEGHNIVAYGFGHQRIAIPGSSISKVILNRTTSVVMLDRDEHVLLRAAGSWNPFGLDAVCSAVSAPRPIQSAMPARNGSAAARKRKQPPPKWPKAASYRRLRVRPRGFAAGMIALGLVAIVFAVLGTFLGALPAVALPGSVGTVRNLIGIAGALIGLTAAVWLFRVCVRTGLAAIRWSTASRQLSSPAPWSPFYPRSANRGGGKLLTAAMVLAVPALIGWGPGIGIVTLAHGFSDQALVSQLRKVGVQAPGLVVGIPQYSTDSDGNTTVTYQANLRFTVGPQSVLTPDPAIGGRIWPIGPDFVMVVYDPAQPETAAVQGQLHGSPWGGAPLGNLISSALLTLLLPVLLWRLVLRITKRRRAAREDMLEGLW
jgi:hypothetical protein